MSIFYDKLRDLIEWCDAHLDEKVSQQYKDQPLAQDWARVAKVAEEAGEAVDALIGITGQNPRKGEYGNEHHLYAELSDAALTGLYALQHFTKDADLTLTILLARAQYHRDRLVASLPCDGSEPHRGPWERIAGSDQADRCVCGFVSGK